LHRERRSASRARRRARPRRPPPYAPYPLRAHTQRHRCDHWSLRSAGEHPCVPSVASGGARWRGSAGRCTVRGVPLAAGAAHVAAMPSTPVRSLVAPARSYLPQPTFPCAYKPVLVVPRAHSFLPRRRRPPLPPLREHRVPSDFLVHPKAPTLPCEPQYLPELRVDQAEPPFRRSPSLRGRRRTAAVELAPPPLLQAL
jgi:hypothetical protein